MSSEDTGFPPDESATRLTEALADVDPFLSATPEDVADDLQRAFGKARVSSTSSLVTSFPAEATEAAMFYVRPALEAKDREIVRRGTEIARLHEQVRRLTAEYRGFASEGSPITFGQAQTAYRAVADDLDAVLRAGSFSLAGQLEAGASSPAVDTGEENGPVNAYEAACERFSRASQNYPKAKAESERIIREADEEFDAAQANLRQYETSPGIPLPEYREPWALPSDAKDKP